ncbi:glycoside hydrolase family 92 protein [Schizopora paradoxa]|uniref:Glycoside hydrolase family 92 protein n=1 Tax=Schizopora paradoxa TaxID=27342 RepID=A0A0H2RIV5_9AGAM|nr:glycoside hydrolase family 92 protein [Schizopora paradoxa]
MQPTNRLQHVTAALVLLGLSYSVWFYVAIYRLPERSISRQEAPPVVIGDLSDLVNVFIGTNGGGHVFPGATVPHGMVKAGMDTDSPGNHAGYDADPKYSVMGFSQLHEDGTGGDIPLSNFKLFPLRDCESFDECPTRRYRRKVPRSLRTNSTGPREFHGALPDDIGSPGYFATNLSTDIRVELTATRRTALHRYTFPPKPEANETDWRPRLIVDLTNDGKESGTNAHVNIDPSVGRVSGYATFESSFGAGWYKAHVCTDFRSASAPQALLTPSEYGTYISSEVHRDAVTFEKSRITWGEHGALLTFENEHSENSSQQPTTILARVGVSFMSETQACQNAEEEIPDFDFERVRGAARSQWNELLGRFQIGADEGERDMAILFYSSLYRSHIVPADYSGENPLWDSPQGTPYYDSLYCNWDTYRTLFPLMSLHDPFTYARIVQSFIDIQKHEGWLPECRSATLQQHVQGGSNGDPILAELYIKYKDHLREFNISADELYHALVQDAEVDSPDFDIVGRQANIWKKYGFIPVGLHSIHGLDSRQVSRTLEYAFDDFTISQVAKGVGKLWDGELYSNRSKGYELVWNPNTTIQDDDFVDIEGIKGFFQPRQADGKFRKTDPRHCTVHDPAHSTCYLDGGDTTGFYEGGPIVYSQYVPHDTARLIELQGGVDAFIRRLDFIFENDYFDSTNEPSQQIPFMYHYANRPALSTERSRQSISTSYNTSVFGLPGNDDAGAMGSYVAYSLLGMYPLPATRQTLISSPYFPSFAIYNPFFDTTTSFIAHGFEGNPLDGHGKVYVKNITIDGKPWHSNCYVEWEVFETGATVELELTDDRTIACGVDDKALPPSLSTGGYD